MSKALFLQEVSRAGKYSRIAPQTGGHAGPGWATWRARSTKSWGAISYGPLPSEATGEGWNQARPLPSA